MGKVDVLVFGRHPDRQLSYRGARARLSPYVRYLTDQDLAMTRTSCGVAPDAPLDDEAITSMIRRDWAEELPDLPESVGRDEHGWYIQSTRPARASWDYWSIGWIHREPLLSRPGRPLVGEESWFNVAREQPSTRVTWVTAASGESVRGQQGHLSDLDLDAMRADTALDDCYAVILDCAWIDRGSPLLGPAPASDGPAWRSYLDGLLRRLPADTLVTAAWCHF